MGRVHNDQCFDAPGVPHRVVPGDDSTPIMPDQDGALNLCGIEESGDIVHQGFNSIGVYARWSRRTTISPEIGCPDSISCLCQRIDLMLP